MFDQQLAQKLSERGIGLRQALEKQLARSLPASGDASAPKTGPGTSDRRAIDAYRPDGLPQSAIDASVGVVVRAATAP